jgi:hypothetical protein
MSAKDIVLNLLLLKGTASKEEIQQALSGVNLPAGVKLRNYVIILMARMVSLQLVEMIDGKYRLGVCKADETKKLKDTV